jgi:predicted Zn-dependent protease
VEAVRLLRREFPQSAFADETLVPSIEAQIATGAFAEARQTIEQYLARATENDPQQSHLWFLLARAREETGDRPGALEAYTRAARFGQGAEWTPAVRLRYAQMLLEEKRWKEGRAALQSLIKGEDLAVAAEAAFYEGESYREEDNESAAVISYMSAAYLAPESPFGRRALLEAATTYAALKQPESAAIAYNKLLAQADLPPDLAERARAGLAALNSR